MLMEEHRGSIYKRQEKNVVLLDHHYQFILLTEAIDLLNEKITHLWEEMDEMEERIDRDLGYDYMN